MQRVYTPEEAERIMDNMARKVNELARKFYSDEKNVKEFEEWHLKTYGCYSYECDD